MFDHLGSSGFLAVLAVLLGLFGLTLRARRLFARPQKPVGELKAAVGKFGGKLEKLSVRLSEERYRGAIKAAGYGVRRRDRWGVLISFNRFFMERFRRTSRAYSQRPSWQSPLIPASS